MPELILMRHAKTEAGGPGASDLTRALTGRGQNDARLVARTLAAAGHLPDRILCSPAVRTRQTLDAILKALPEKPAIEIVEGLYGAKSPTYLDIVRKLGGSASRLMVIGHNPMIHATARAAAGSGPAALRERLDERFPTAAFAVIAFEVGQWPEARPGDGRLIVFTRPAELGGGPGI